MLWNILVPDGSEKEELIQKLLDGYLIEKIATKEKALFTTSLIEKYIREEEVHDIHVVTNARGQTLHSMSSGERKKAFLNHILKLEPELIILDTPLDSLDTMSRKELQSTLMRLAEKEDLVNVVSRQRDLLEVPCPTFLYQNGILKEWKEPNQKNGRSIGRVPEAIKPINTDQKTLIWMKDVKVSYKERPILKGINWKIGKGEFWQLKGPNGAGKTTLLSMISGDNPKAFGQDILLFGFKKGSGESVWDIKRNIGYYSSVMTHRFSRNQTVLQMIISGYFDSVGLYSKPTELQLKRAYEWLELIGLESMSKKPFINLPAGQQRLVLVVRAMVKHPPMLILDEPSSSLNDADVYILTSLINQFAQESNTTILYVSHRDEPGLRPNRIFELIPERSGSIGRVHELQD